MNARKLRWMCGLWGIAKAALLWGDQPAPASIFARIQDYGAGAPATRGEIRRELESLRDEALDVNCAIWIALSPDLPRGQRLTEAQYEGLYVYHLPVEGEDGRLMSIEEKAEMLGVGKGTLRQHESRAREKIAPYVGRDQRRRWAEEHIQGFVAQGGKKYGIIT